MTVSVPTSGSTVDASDITTMHEQLRDVVNDEKASNVERHSLGPQHLPSAVVGCDYVCVTTEYEVVWDRSWGPPSHDITAETIADISGGNWLTLSAYDLDNGGAGYTLPPCKVLVMFNCSVTEFARNDIDNQLWINIYTTIDGVDTYDQRQGGMIFPYEGPDVPSGQEDDFDAPIYNTDQPVAIAFVIDQTDAGGNWSLDLIRVKSGVARGKSTSLSSWSAKITTGTLSFVAFYQDE